MVIILIANRIIYEAFKFRIKLAKSKIDVFLTSLIFCPFDEEDFAFEIEGFKKRIPFHKNWCKEIILNEIINLKQNLKGETSNNLHFIYEQFDLFNYSISFVKNKQWYIKSIGLFHFQALGYIKAEEYVIPYLNDKNKTLSTNAYIALIALTSDKLDFLSDYPDSISLTSEIKIMDILHSRKPPMPTNLAEWIYSPNPSIVKLGVKFMAYYNFTITKKEMLNLFETGSKDIRKEVILATRNLYVEDAENILIQQFEKEQKNNRIEILTTLGEIGSEVSLNFLSKLIMETIDADVKLAAVYSINAIDGTFFDHSFTNNEEIMKMKRHVKDPYI